MVILRHGLVRHCGGVGRRISRGWGGDNKRRQRQQLQQSKQSSHGDERRTCEDPKRNPRRWLAMGAPLLQKEPCVQTVVVTTSLRIRAPAVGVCALARFSLPYYFQRILSYTSLQVMTVSGKPDATSPATSS